MPTLNYVAIGIFAFVYMLIILRNFRRLRLPVWTIMMTGAVAENRGAGFSFVEFAKIGLLVTIPNS